MMALRYMDVSLLGCLVFDYVFDDAEKDYISKADYRGCE